MENSETAVFWKKSSNATVLEADEIISADKTIAQVLNSDML